MEDFVFVKQLVLNGHKPLLLPTSVATSNRRWQNVGPVKACLINYLMVTGYFLGIPLAKLAQWYRKTLREKPSEGAFFAEGLAKEAWGVFFELVAEVSDLDRRIKEL